MSTTSDYYGNAGRRSALMSDRDRAMRLLYDKGRWIGGKLLSGTLQEQSERLYYGSSGSNSSLIETPFRYGSGTRFKNIIATVRLVLATSTSTSYNTSLRIGYLDASDSFVELRATSVKANVAHDAIAADGEYILVSDLGTITASKLNAAKGRKVILRWMGYFGTWAADKIEINPTQL